MNGISNRAAIVGIGATEFSKNSGRSELRLAVEATLAALADAGIDPAEVDGMATYTMDNNPEIELLRAIGGRSLKFFSRTHYGGGAACALPLPDFSHSGVTPAALAMASSSRGFCRAPDSILPIVPWDTPAAAASCAWLQLF